jgi:hypothetical protein
MILLSATVPVNRNITFLCLYELVAHMLYLKYTAVHVNKGKSQIAIGQG